MSGNRAAWHTLCARLKDVLMSFRSSSPGVGMWSDSRMLCRKMARGDRRTDSSSSVLPLFTEWNCK